MKNIALRGQRREHSEFERPDQVNRSERQEGVRHQLQNNVFVADSTGDEEQRDDLLERATKTRSTEFALFVFKCRSMTVCLSDWHSSV
ncbi:hypothetical protein [Pseudomonas sp. CCI3.1]|uniref:hypothetical protein n=1 Tax=Pseudomonas sp. CCI3.1 TaxID=3048618 RepID=UPI002AB52FAD|nr:hypothetical protein [Pseudomonas sp. CCI3.1]MDY7580619.1 hypothetical protein [Pseudomonas sp. CCI3.1]